MNPLDKIFRINQITLSIVFIGSGLIPLFLSDPIIRLQLLDPFALPTSWQLPMFYSLVALDIICGILILFYPSRLMWLVLFIVVLGYTSIITIIHPDLWREPFGTLFKNFPILILIWTNFFLEGQRHV